SRRDGGSVINLRQTVMLKQELKLAQILSPKMIQMLRMFNMSYSDLLDRVNEEVRENVVLEVVKYDQLGEYSMARRSRNDMEFMGRDVADFAKASSDKDQLHTYLLSQLELENLNDLDREIAEHLIQNIDDRGYILNYAEVRDGLIAKFAVEDRKVLQILRVIHSFEPDGVGARSLKECLSIQIDNYSFENERLREVLRQAVKHQLDELAAQQYDKVARFLGIEPAGAEALGEFIKQNLNPNPGAQFSNAQFNMHVIPSFEVYLEDDVMVLTNLEKSKGIQLGISEKYSQMLSDPKLDAETRQYLEIQMNRAKEMIDNVQRRLDSLDNIVKFILNRQIEFLRHGYLYMVPLLQKEVAEKMEMSSSTVSRIVSSKYIQTQWGLFSLKQLCPRDHFGQTAKRLELVILQTIKDNPQLSDLRLSKLLAERGIP
ncbi:hypothetical protein EBR96_09865, partial [bacterium]|nr:hypothetical protein [bacterium]